MIRKKKKKMKNIFFLEEILLFPISVDSALKMHFLLSYCVRKIWFGQKWT